MTCLTVGVASPGAAQLSRLAASEGVKNVHASCEGSAPASLEAQEVRA